jgi:hypothetical protein
MESRSLDPARARLSKEAEPRLSESAADRTLEEWAGPRSVSGGAQTPAEHPREPARAERLDRADSATRPDALKELVQYWAG